MRGLQPVFSAHGEPGSVPLRLQVVNIDPNYFTPLEAAGVNHYSLLKRLSAFGILGVVHFAVRVAALAVQADHCVRANGRMDECFRSLAFRLRPIAPGGTTEGFIFTRLDCGNQDRAHLPARNGDGRRR